MEKEVSIIVPVYRTEKYLEKCIDSIVKQSYKRLQILLIDDGSPDNSGKICDDWAKRDNRIQVIHQKNQGVSAARNSGIEKAKGTYLCFVDSDDYILSDYISNLVKNIEQEKTDWAMCGFYRKQDNYNYTDGYQSCRIKKEDKSYYWYACIDLKGRYLWNKIYDTNIIQTNNIHFEVGIHPGEDTLFNLQYSFHADKMSIISEPLYVYVDSDNSVMKRDLKKSAFENYERQIQPYSQLLKRDLRENEKECVYLRIIEVSINLIYDNRKYRRGFNVEQYKVYVRKNFYKYLQATYIPVRMKIRYILQLLSPGVFDVVKNIYRFLKGLKGRKTDNVY